jgi:metallo-beta-lactamase class B
VEEDGRRYQAVFIGGVSINQGVRLLGNARHPQIVEDYARTFRVLEELRPDVWFAQHPEMFRLEAKVERLRAGGGANPFLDADGYAAFVAGAKDRYLGQLAEEQGRTPR